MEADAELNQEMQQDNGIDKSTNHCLDKCDSPTQTTEMQASSIDFSGFINSEQNGQYHGSPCSLLNIIDKEYAGNPLICKIKKSPIRKKLDELGQRKFHQAVAINNVEKVQELLATGISPNTCDKQGRTPLHLAACRGYTEMVKLLIDYGANPNLRDCIGNTPLHLAAVASNVAVVTLLLKAGTDVLSIDNHGHNPIQVAESKLRILQKYKAPDFNRIKEEVHSITNMLLAYLEIQTDKNKEISELIDFSSKHSLSSNSDEVQDNVKDLLTKISFLNIN